MGVGVPLPGELEYRSSLMLCESRRGFSRGFLGTPEGFPPPGIFLVTLWPRTQPLLNALDDMMSLMFETQSSCVFDTVRHPLAEYMASGLDVGVAYTQSPPKDILELR